MAADKDGTVLMMQHGLRRIVRLDDKLAMTPFLTAYEGKQFNSPNDLVFSPDARCISPIRRTGLFSPATPNADLDRIRVAQSPSTACIATRTANDCRHHGS
jgi:hypothetical protein